MKVSCSNGFAPGDVVRRRRPCLVGDWKIQFKGVFPLCKATDATINSTNNMVSSQNAFSTKGSIIIGSLSPNTFGGKISSFSDPGCFSWIVDPGSEFFQSQIPNQNFCILDSWSRIWIFSIPDPGSRMRIKEFRYFNPKKWFLSYQKYDPSFWSRIRILTFYLSQIPILDPRSRIQWSKRHWIPDPGSGFATLEISGLLRLQGVALVTDFQSALLS